MYTNLVAQSRLFLHNNRTPRLLNLNYKYCFEYYIIGRNGSSQSYQNKSNHLVKLNSNSSTNSNLSWKRIIYNGNWLSISKCNSIDNDDYGSIIQISLPNLILAKINFRNYSTKSLNQWKLFSQSSINKINQNQTLQDQFKLLKLIKMSFATSTSTSKSSSQCNQSQSSSNKINDGSTANNNKKTSSDNNNKDTKKYQISKEELKARLSPIEYQVTQEKATERPFTGKYNKFNEKGTYHCIVCDEKLFSSESKFDSGCGWPAFSEAFEQNKIKYVKDYSMVGSNILLLVKNSNLVRIEVLCANCNAHLGHVFDDGPGPTRKRYCINSASLLFKPPQNSSSSTPTTTNTTRTTTTTGSSSSSQTIKSTTV